MKQVKYSSLIMLTLSVLMLMGACRKFLDIRPDKKQIIPKDLKDCRALLDDYQTMNTLYPSDGEVAADNYSITPANWLSLRNQEDRDTYIWDADGEHLTNQWLGPYQIVYNANLVLETLRRIIPSAAETDQYNEIKGTALFFRAYAFHQVAQIFTAPYDPKNADKFPGIPLRLSPDMAVKSTRGTLAQTYNQIKDDLMGTLTLLPLNTTFPSRPNKVAAYALMARVFLSMQEYEMAGEMANECLKIKSDLMNYNLINIVANMPFPQFNKEVIFNSISTASDLLYPSIANVDQALLDSYEPDDLRLVAFYENNNNGTYSFKGNYDGMANTSSLFNGLAIDEVYLIRAECYARAGDAISAIADLNTLLKNRIDEGSYTPYIITNADIALSKILEERRKELPFRNLRWTDLRRLNTDERFAVTLQRKLIIDGEEKTYSLAPNDLRYTFLIPRDVMNNTDLKQNER